MNTHRYVALLRGINIGGNNVIKMVDLRTCFEGMGFTNVETYIQSGNVVFSTRVAGNATLEAQIEATLSKTFRYDARLVLMSAKALARTVTQAPPGFGSQAERYRYDVLFVKAPLSSELALAQLTTTPGVDTAHAGDHAVYFRRLISKATKSRLVKLIQMPIYKSITVRNWNTTTKLLTMALRPAGD